MKSTDFQISEKKEELTEETKIIVISDEIDLQKMYDEIDDTAYDYGHDCGPNKFDTEKPYSRHGLAVAPNRYTNAKYGDNPLADVDDLKEAASGMKTYKVDLTPEEVKIIKQVLKIEGDAKSKDVIKKIKNMFK